MCDTCGCGQGEEITIRKPGEKVDQHTHAHTHDGSVHSHSHHGADGLHHHHDQGRAVLVEQDVLLKNNLLAERNRGYFEAKSLTTLNLVSSPGSGKTSLLEKTISDLKEQHHFYVIEGDQQTMNDADRINKTGTEVVQINTGDGCHLDSSMIQNAIKKLQISKPGFLMIENVGNLVCPALFDLGEEKRVVIMSTTEGEDKPAKYPTMFQSADLCIINKIDLLPYLDFNMKEAKDYARKVNPKLEFIELSVRSGDGMEQWYDWLKALIRV
ncbi:MAG: hydrogenase accessory protein HypB [Bacteroidetes bacterium]|nr:MAG: hydrogenase accessory protein HypB [Bacteroidota bacterium]